MDIFKVEVHFRKWPKDNKTKCHGDGESRHGSRNAPSRVIPNKGSRQESILSVQDINIQSHVLINLKDSNKVGIDLFYRETMCKYFGNCKLQAVLYI
ncbi:hypothetical protein SASPL_101697 [Salvia splendens]|uniref:Uncharacterized protein n=1 Tax=Salvia splendens TaxID=180675 RepID=A0A8X8YS74_SALSN|nr:hypothetical protein SASPL_101697 [Salvia splendens]